MTKVVTMKLTLAEVDVLEALFRRSRADSRSDILRLALRQYAEREGMQQGELRRIDDERGNQHRRRANDLSRLIGPIGRRPHVAAGRQ